MSVAMSISLSGDRELKALLARAANASVNLEPALRQCLPIIRRSLAETFRANGRPMPWPDRWKALEHLFPNLAGKNPLQVTGHLRQSVIQDPEVVVTRDTLTYGTSLEYARVQHFGGPSKVKPPPGKIRYRKADGAPYVVIPGQNGWYAKKLDPDLTFTIQVRPRPFMMLFEEDARAIVERFKNFLRNALRGKEART